MKVIVVCGPTASGKTALSIELARRLDGEVISADSMQVYRELNIGTAKPDAEEMRGVPHHMLDVVSVRETYSVSRYEKEAAACVDDVISRGKQPIVCGGTGLYIDALIKGAGFLDNDESGQVRAGLERRWDQGGAEAMMARLSGIDPESAARLHINDRKRIIRALEVFEITGKTITQHNLETQSRPPRYDSVFIGVRPSMRQTLYDRINVRVDRMMERRLEAEVRDLMERGLLVNTAAQAIGYKELSDYIRGNAGLDECVELVKQKSRNYAKRQLTWFGRDSRVGWVEYESGEDVSAVADKSTNFLREAGVLL